MTFVPSFQGLTCAHRSPSCGMQALPCTSSKLIPYKRMPIAQPDSSGASGEDTTSLGTKSTVGRQIGTRSSMREARVQEKAPALYAPFPFSVCSPFSQVSALFVRAEGQKADEFYLECFFSPLEALIHSSLPLRPSNTAPQDRTLPHPATISPPPLPPLAVA